MAVIETAAATAGAVPGNEMDSDLGIIQQVLAGETERYGELVQRYQLAAWKLAYSFVGDFEEARDLSQNGFVQAYQNLRRFRNDSKFSTWLYRIIANECKDFLRSKGRRPVLVSLSPPESSDGEEPALGFELEDRSADPREAAHQRELAVQLAQAVEQLPLRQRAAFLLRHANGMSLEEAAQVLGCRVGTVKAHLFRASEALRQILEPFLSSSEVHP